MLLELQNLGKSFGEHEVLRDVNAGVAVSYTHLTLPTKA